MWLWALKKDFLKIAYLKNEKVLGSVLHVHIVLIYIIIFFCLLGNILYLL